MIQHPDTHMKTLSIGCIFHNRHAITTFHILRGILSGSQEHRCDDIGRMSVEPPDTTGHGRTNVVLLFVGFDHIVNGALQSVANDAVGDNRFTYHTFTTA